MNYKGNVKLSNCQKYAGSAPRFSRHDFLGIRGRIKGEKTEWLLEHASTAERMGAGVVRESVDCIRDVDKPKIQNSLYPGLRSVTSTTTRTVRLDRNGRL